MLVLIDCRAKIIADATINKDVTLSNGKSLSPTTVSSEPENFATFVYPCIYRWSL